MLSKAKKEALEKKLDQFYTDISYSKYFYSIINEYINLDDMDILLEPSAGTRFIFLFNG